jgi:hypothetical protein
MTNKINKTRIIPVLVKPAPYPAHEHEPVYAMDMSLLSASIKYFMLSAEDMFGRRHHNVQSNVCLCNRSLGGTHLYVD